MVNLKRERLQPKIFIDGVLITDVAKAILINGGDAVSVSSRLTHTNLPKLDKGETVGVEMTALDGRKIIFSKGIVTYSGVEISMNDKLLTIQIKNDR